MEVAEARDSRTQPSVHPVQPEQIQGRRERQERDVDDFRERWMRETVEERSRKVRIVEVERDKKNYTEYTNWESCIDIINGSRQTKRVPTEDTAGFQRVRRVNPVGGEEL
ncbi:hypothetical protein Tco_0957490 [Tanacetum coccineum]